MHNLKRIGAVLAAVVLACCLHITALAAVEDTGFSDVAADAWYADAAAYVRDNGLMNGVTATAFAPDGIMTRAMLAQTLYRAAGSPAVPMQPEYTDVPAETWYSDAVAWATVEGLTGGYGDGRFGPGDSVSREQISAILWRYAGSPAAGTGTDFADEDDISDYAAQAVDWARAGGIVNGVGENRFLPRSSATRAQAAVILHNYLTMAAPQEPEQPQDSSRVLVAYFSATGNTERVANAIAETTGGDLFEITPADPYTSDDLNWTDENSRVVYEYENPEARDTELAACTPENWADYGVVFVGYPIWWYDAAWPVEGFVTANDFTGKTVIPFCTSSSSGLGESGRRLAQLAGTGTWLEGQRFRSGAAREDVASWVERLDLA